MHSHEWDVPSDELRESRERGPTSSQDTLCKGELAATMIHEEGRHNLHNEGVRYIKRRSRVMDGEPR